MDSPSDDLLASYARELSAETELRILAQCMADMHQWPMVSPTTTERLRRWHVEAEGKTWAEIEDEPKIDPA